MAYILSFKKKHFSSYYNPFRFPILKTKHNKFSSISIKILNLFLFNKDKFNAAIKDQKTLLNFYIKEFGIRMIISSPVV
jgi:hypothetical protein